MAVGVNAGRHHPGDVHDPAGLAALDHQGVHPDIRIRAGVQRAAAEGRHLAVQSPGQLGDR